MRIIMMTAVALVMSLSACKKGNSENMSRHSFDKLNSRSAVLPQGPANPDNPYDGVGALHNRLMDYIEKHRPADTKDRKFSVQLIRRFYKEQGWNVPDEALFLSVPQTIRNAQEDIHGLVIAKTSYSKPVKEALDSLLFLLESLADQNDYGTVKENIVAFEMMFGEYNLSVEDRAIILKTSSIARYSSYYWMSRQPAISATPGAAMKFKDFVRWFAGITSDIGGFITTLDAGYAAECSDEARETVDYCMP